MISASPTGPATRSMLAWPAMPIDDQRVEDAHDGAEQTDERRHRTDGGEERQPALQLAVDLLDRALQRHRDPLVQIDAIGQATVMVRGGAQAVFGDGAVLIALVRRSTPSFSEGAVQNCFSTSLAGGRELALIPELGEDDVPGDQRHQQPG